MSDKNKKESGNLLHIGRSFASEAQSVLKMFDDFKKKNIGKISDSCAFDLLHNAIVANKLGFKEANTSKHGWDCQYSKDRKLHLEVKNVSMSADVKNVNFNDVTLEKANSFGKEDVFVGVAIWDDGEPLCVIFGKSARGLSQHLVKKTEENKKRKKNKRNTRTVQPFDFVDKFGFRIVTKKPDKILYKLGSFDKRFYDLDKSNVVSFSDFDIREFDTAENSSN